MNRIDERKTMRTGMSVLFTTIALCGSAWADKSHDDAMAKMQQQLNKEVMEKPFLAEEPEKVDAYIKEASARHIKPPEYTGSNWRPGYTCRDLLRYSWHEYRNCSYYHHYHGYYYPYP